MAIPYHTHSFEIPTATKDDILAGVSNDKVVVPALLGTAALKSSDDFATAEQGAKADTAAQKDLLISVDEGLEGGGTLSSNITIKFSEKTRQSLIKADKAVPNTTNIKAGDGLIGGGDLTADTELSLSPEVFTAIDNANSAVQPKDLKKLAFKDKVDIADINTESSPTASSFLSGDGTWKIPNGSGDMLAKTYDPNNINADAFSMGNMVETDEAKIMSAQEREKLNELYDGMPIVLASFQIGLVPVGTTIYFDGTIPPKGYLLRNGALLSISAYPELFKILGTRYGGNGTTTFGVGDFRSVFIRGLDMGRGIDNGRTLGSQQGDAIRNIIGYVNAPTYGGWINTDSHGGALYPSGTLNPWVTQFTNSNGQIAANVLNFDAARSVPTANENRPLNIALLACIKY